ITTAPFLGRARDGTIRIALGPSISSLAIRPADVDAACARGPGCPRLVIPWFDVTRLERPSVWSSVAFADHAHPYFHERSIRDDAVELPDGTLRYFGIDVVDYARDGSVVRRFPNVTSVLAPGRYFGWR